MNVQPSTWVEFNVPVEEVQRVRNVLAGSGRAEAVFRGTLYGPRSVGQEALVTDAVAAMSQLSGRRYGHLGMFRTKLIVDEVVSVRGIPPAGTSPETPGDDPQRVTSASIPFYPSSARMAGVAGDVLFEIAVRSGQVASIRTIRGHPLLAQAARDNIRTWTFEGGDGTYATTFAFRLVKIGSAAAKGVPHVELALPHIITITDVESKQ